MRVLIVAMTLSVAIVTQAQTSTSVTTATSSQTAPSADATAAAKIPEQLFAAMKAKDADGIRSLFIKDGQLVAIDRPRTGDGPSTTRLFTGDAFAKLIAESKADDFIEEMKTPEVMILGDLAIVFGRYTFHVGGKFSHCGTNSFHLVRTSEGWKIANAASTLEFNCSH